MDKYIESHDITDNPCKCGHLIRNIQNRILSTMNVIQMFLRTEVLVGMAEQCISKQRVCLFIIYAKLCWSTSSDLYSFSGAWHEYPYGTENE